MDESENLTTNLAESDGADDGDAEVLSGEERFSLTFCFPLSLEPSWPVEEYDMFSG